MVVIQLNTSFCDFKKRIFKRKENIVPRVAAQHDWYRKINNKYIKSPLNYVGGKYKLLKEIIPLFPENIRTFIDVFGGGFNVGINVNAENIIYNDLQKQVVGFLRHLQNNNIEDLL